MSWAPTMRWKRSRLRQNGIAHNISDSAPVDDDAILHHHEWFNGGGYPGGLAGEDIALLSAILAVVDAYDAMMNDWT